MLKVLRRNTYPIKERTWGTEVWIVNESYCCKEMFLRPLHWGSLHFHREKHETFLVHSPLVVYTVEFHKDDLEFFRTWNKFPSIRECESTLLISHRGNKFEVPGLHKSKFLLDEGDSIQIPPYTAHFFTSEKSSYFTEISTHHKDSDVVRILEGGEAL